MRGMRRIAGFAAVTAIVLSGCASDASEHTSAFSCDRPLGPLPGWQGDTLSHESRCAAYQLAVAALAGLPHQAVSYAPDFSPSDTARIRRAYIAEMYEIRDSVNVPWRVVELDIEGQPRLFSVRQDRRSGDIEVRQIHR